MDAESESTVEDSLSYLPKLETIERLALNDSGFVFDPVTGRSFTASSTGLYILRFVQKNTNTDDLIRAIEGDYDIDRLTIERDISDFSAQLRELLS